MIYLKTYNVSKVGKDFTVQLTPKSIPMCVLIWCTHPQNLMLIGQKKLKLAEKKFWRPLAHPTTDIPNLIIRFHNHVSPRKKLVKKQMKK